ncbi:unnamed protein product [Nesidiocoris tenuis]|uniref:Uncharacterized protein n=1 Tax=Nesidiocoris tenuis TaxID=355587 RepID=A0A6H5HCJ1_9HEMI|nr:unnamed protein product [Nesidiocoris tenuis]
MSANSLNADGLEELLEEAEFVKDTGRTKDEGDFSMIGDALMMAKKDESPDSELSLPAAGPSSAAPRGVDKKLLQKHVDIVKNVKLPAKMSREKIGMAEKLTKNDKLEDDSQPSKVGADASADDSTSIQIRQILQDCRDFIMHALLLALVTTIVIYMVPWSRFYYHDIFTHFLTDSTFMTEAGLYKNFWEIVVVDHIWDYFSGILIPLIYSGVNDKMAASHLAKLKNPKDLLLVNDNILVALPRIRQVRVRNDSCHVPEGFLYIFDSCYYFFKPHLEDTEPFGLGNGTIWTYSNASVTGARGVAGEITTYTGGGYYMDFSSSLEETLKLYNEMYNNTWIDHGTRAVMVDLASYTQRDNLFCIVTLLIELPPSGGAIPSADVRVQKLLRYESTLDCVMLGFELALTALLVLLTLDNILKLVHQPMQYISNLWNALDWVMLPLGYAAAAVGVWRYFTVEEQLSGLLDAIRQKKHFNFHSIRTVHTTYEELFGCFAFIAWLKTCRYVIICCLSLLATPTYCRRMWQH